MKKCPKCDAQFEDKFNFCSKDGSELVEMDQSDAAMISGSTVMAAGDVNISKTVQQNITNIRQDDTKKIMTCVVSGRQDVISEGALCHICGQWAHKSHFYPKHKECEKCHTEKELNIKCEYRNLFEESIIDDDKIDSDERSVLQAVAKDLGLSQNEVEQIESEVRKKRQSRLFAIRSPEENIRIKKASKLLLKSCQYKQAYTELENLTKSLKKDLEVSNLYVLAAIAHNPKVAIEVLDRDPKYSVDTPKKSFLRVCALEAMGKDGEASSELKKAVFIFPDDLALKAKVLERFVDIYLQDEQEDEQFQDMLEYFKGSKLNENTADPYIKYVVEYFRFAKNQDSSVSDMISALECPYYAKRKPILIQFEKNFLETKKKQEEEQKEKDRKDRELKARDIAQRAKELQEQKELEKENAQIKKEQIEYWTKRVVYFALPLVSCCLFFPNPVAAVFVWLLLLFLKVIISWKFLGERGGIFDELPKSKKLLIMTIIVDVLILILAFGSYLQDSKSKNISFLDGSYTGSLKNKVPHGFGKWARKDKGGNLHYYEGEWRSGYRHGQGEEDYGNGSLYVGGFAKDMRHGRGKFFSNGRLVYEGEFRNNHIVHAN